MDRRLFLLAIAANCMTGFALVAAAFRRDQGAPAPLGWSTTPTLEFRKSDDSAYAIEPGPEPLPFYWKCNRCSQLVPPPRIDRPGVVEWGDAYHTYIRNEANTQTLMACYSPRRQA